MILEIIVGCVIAAVGAYFYKQNKKNKKEQTTVVSNSMPFPCVIEGSVDAPPMVDRVKALAIEAQTKGIVITGDYVADYQQQGGEMMLTGYGFKFVLDKNGQFEPAETYCNIFGVSYSCSGGMNPDGTLGADVVVGAARVQIQGAVVNGKFVNGKIVKSWLPHIFGVLSGVYHKV